MEQAILLSLAAATAAVTLRERTIRAGLLDEVKGWGVGRGRLLAGERLGRSVVFGPVAVYCQKPFDG